MSTQDFMTCSHCQAEMDWEDCHACGGEGWFDAYADEPDWFNPGDVETCRECDGKGGGWFCGNSRCHADVTGAAV